MILYLENSDKSRFADLKKRVENDYVLNKGRIPKDGDLSTESPIKVST